MRVTTAQHGEHHITFQITLRFEAALVLKSSRILPRIFEIDRDELLKRLFPT